MIFKVLISDEETNDDSWETVEVSFDGLRVNV